MKNKLISVFFSSLLLLSGVGLTSCELNNNSSNNIEVKDKYTVIFNLMYDNKTRPVTVNNGGKATAYNPKRAGYTLEGWYYENTFKTKFDFNTPITSDLTLYAKWSKNDDTVYHDVVFDLNYGDKRDVIVSSAEGQVIKEIDVPNVDRLGYEVIAWYTSEDLKEGTEFDIENDVVTGPMTLYAKYGRDSSLVTDNSGNIVYENVSFTFAINDPIGLNSPIMKVVNKFNKEYTGKIKVNVVEQGLVDNSLITLKLHQTEDFNHSGYYYNMEDVLDLAGITFNSSDYYEGQIAENYLNGKLRSLPIGSLAPFVIYNKEMLNEYNNGKVPTNNEEWVKLFSKVNRANKRKEGWKGAVNISTNWEMLEITSHAVYLQNGAPFIEKNSSGDLVNTWLDSEENKQEVINAVNQFRQFYASENSFGTYKINSWGGPQRYIGEGKAFAAVSGIPSLLTLAGTSFGVSDEKIFDKLDVATLSNFYATDPNHEMANKILVKGLSLGVSNMPDENLMKIAAAGVFSDYLGKHAEELISRFLYPARISSQDKLFRNNPSDWRVEFLKKCGDAENFVSYPGHQNTKTIYNYYNELFLFDISDETISDGKINQYITETANRIEAALK